MLRDEAVSPACVHTAQLQQLWENDAQSQHQAILELKLQSCNTREQLTNVKRRLSELEANGRTCALHQAMRDSLQESQESHCRQATDRVRSPASRAPPRGRADALTNKHALNPSRSYATASRAVFTRIASEHPRKASRQRLLRSRPLCGGGRSPPADSFPPSGEDADLAEALRQSLASNRQREAAILVARAHLRRRMPPGYCMQTVLGDGNCLFTAVQRGFRELPNPTPVPPCFRALCVRTMRAVPRFAELFHFREDFENYCTKMSTNGVYGDAVCLDALADALCVSIRVILPEGDPITFGSHPACVYVAFNGVDHYDAVLPTVRASQGPLVGIVSSPVEPSSAPLQQRRVRGKQPNRTQPCARTAGPSDRDTLSIVVGSAPPRVGSASNSLRRLRVRGKHTEPAQADAGPVVPTDRQTPGVEMATDSVCAGPTGGPPRRLRVHGKQPDPAQPGDAEPPEAGSAASDAKCLEILSANITSWNTRHSLFSKTTAHVSCFQETRLCRQDAAAASRTCRQNGQRLLCGEPVTQQGGVAIQARSPLKCIEPPSSLKTWFDSGRFVAAWVPLGAGHRSVLVCSLYGISGAHPTKNSDKFRRNEDFLSEIFAWLATFGKVPCFICADFNVDPSISNACTAACATGMWHDLGAEAGSQPTFECVRHKKPVASRIDGVLCNACARPWVEQYSLHDFNIPNQKVITVKVRLPPFAATITVLRRPKPYRAPPDDADRAAISATHFPSHDPEWRGALATCDVQAVWTKWCQSCHALMLALGRQHSPATSERGAPPRPTKRLAFPPATAEGSMTVRMSRLLRLQRRAHECSMQVARRGVVQPELDRAFRQAFAALCANSEFQNFKLATKQIKNAIHCESQRVVLQRLAAWKAKMHASWSSNKSLVFRWIRLRKAIVHSPEFLPVKFGLCAAPEVLLRQVVDKWLPVYQAYTETNQPSWDVFMARFGQYMTHYPCALFPLEARNLRKIACSKGPKAPGADQWHHADFLQWPQATWQRLTEFLALVEQQGMWPDDMLHFLVTLIPKQHASDGADLRPISVAPSVYRLTVGAGCYFRGRRKPPGLGSVPPGCS